MNAVLSPRRQVMMRYIREFRSAHGFAPTVRELMPAAGTRTTHTVFANLRVLEDKGLLRLTRGVARGIHVVGAYKAVPIVGYLGDNGFEPLR